MPLPGAHSLLWRLFGPWWQFSLWVWPDLSGCLCLAIPVSKTLGILNSQSKWTSKGQRKTRWTHMQGLTYTHTHNHRHTHTILYTHTHTESQTHPCNLSHPPLTPSLSKYQKSHIKAHIMCSIFIRVDMCWFTSVNGILWDVKISTALPWQTMLSE